MNEDEQQARDALHRLFAEIDGEIAALAAPLVRLLTSAITRAKDRKGVVPVQRLPTLQSVLATLIEQAFGTSPAAQFDSAGRPQTPIARVLADATHASTRLALAPLDQRMQTLAQSQPQIYAQIRARAARPLRVETARLWVDPNGYTLSDRLWQNGQDVRSAIDSLLQYHVSRGTDAQTMGRELEQFLTVQGRRERTPTPYGTRGLYAPRRLARTEAARAFGVATDAAAKRNPWVQATGWRLSAAHPEQDICDEHATRDVGFGKGNYPPGSVPQYPPHPQCLCYLVPVVTTDERAIADLTRWVQGDDVPRLRDLDSSATDASALISALTGIPASE